MNGIIILDKPGGFTSFDGVAVLRGLSRQKKSRNCSRILTACR